ncbi:hypothetical protein OG275_00345 [Streptomyces niveus]|uniref:hypothetical protein n=1 Tax=Streptomyces niveus TaxID=193462 RepID=UPI002E313251|nr:hypothetical protein [Streptomyces niveus]
MSAEQDNEDAYGKELAAISRHQSEATNARFTVFQALVAVGIGHEQAGEITAEPFATSSSNDQSATMGPRLSAAGERGTN